MNGSVADPMRMCRSAGIFFVTGALLWPRHANATIADNKADAVFGQKDLAAGSAPKSAAGDNLLAPQGVVMGLCASLGSVHLVADTEHHRVLVLRRPWEALAAAVIGQSDFGGALANQGGLPTEETLSGPTAVSMDGAEYAIADTGNHRVVRGTCNVSTSSVFGQKTFYTAVRNQGGVSPTSMSAPSGVVLYGESLYVADTDNHRVLYFVDSGGPTASSAVACLGQKDCYTALENFGKPTPTSGSLKSPHGLAIKGNRMLVADTGNNRVVEYSDRSPIWTYGGTGAISAMTMNAPIAVAYDPIGYGVWVVDQGNRRVLHFAQHSFLANIVLGQKDFATSESAPASASSFVSPTAVASDGGGSIVVADGGAHRVLRFNFACAPGICDDGDACTDDTCTTLGCSSVFREYSLQCAPYACDVSARTCLTSCATRACAPGYRCGPFKQCIKTCTGGATCSPGYTCVDGICCNAPCNGKCESCTIPGNEGTCIPLSGLPRRPCAIRGECAGSCDGRERNECTPLHEGVTCGAETCSDGVATTRGTCDGAGHCQQPRASCAPYACGGGVCNADCRFDFDCDPSAHCEGSVCVSSLRASGDGCTHAGAVEGTSVTLVLWLLSAASSVVRRRQRT